MRSELSTLRMHQKIMEQDLSDLKTQVSSMRLRQKTDTSVQKEIQEMHRQIQQIQRGTKGIK